jgi:flavodoxin
MKIGIIIHTQSGHTAHFARAIAAKFNSNGHEAEIEMLRTSGQVSPGSRKFTIKNSPEVEQFDAILLGGPVWAFKASPVIMAYLSQLNHIKNKKVLSFVTMMLPFTFMGGKQAIKAMNQELEASGGNVLPGEILQFFFKANPQKMEQAVERIYDAITKK